MYRISFLVCKLNLIFLFYSTTYSMYKNDCFLIYYFDSTFPFGQLAHTRVIHEVSYNSLKYLKQVFKF